MKPDITEKNNGLPAEDLREIRKVIEPIEEIEEVILFGSRAMGNFKKGSDVDLAVTGEGITKALITRLTARLNEETVLPYFFDVIDLAHLKHKGLKEHIAKYGVTIYKKSPKKT